MTFRCTTFAGSLIKTAAVLGSIALAATPVVPALAAPGAPTQVLYVFPGVRDDGGGASTGVATVVHCFSFSSTTESIGFIVRDNAGTVVANAEINIASFQTATAVTHVTDLYPQDAVLNTGSVGRGVLGIAATSTNMVCTAQVIDAGAFVPNGIDLHGLRLNPLPGTQE